jgi:hypothetical protein
MGSNGGGYFRSAFAVVVVLALTTAAHAVTLFSDDFNTAGSSANYTLVVTSADTDVQFAFDYSTMGIPVAPHTTDGSTKGVRMDANLANPTGAEAVTLHTTQSFNGAYIVQFDMWINANGPFPNAPTGTEGLTAGVGGDGATVNGSTGATSIPTTGIGGWTTVTGEGGAARDFRLHKGTTEQGVTTGQYLAGNTAQTPGVQDGAHAYYGTTFPTVDVGKLPVQGASNGGGANQTGSTAIGSAGFAWHTVKLTVNPTGGRGGAAAVTWTIDALDIGKLDAGNSGSFSTTGKVTIGYWDMFASVADNALYSFGLVDNLRVSDVPTNNPDFNGNHLVDAGDYVVWRRFNGGAGAQNQGDANGDGNVNNVDYDLWRAAFGNAIGSGSGTLVSSVPEPSTLCLFPLAAVVVTIRRRK